MIFQGDGAAPDSDVGFDHTSSCGHKTRKGAPCKNAPVMWFSDWPPPEAPGRCKTHLTAEDRALLEGCLLAGEQERQKLVPACWSWPLPFSDGTEPPSSPQMPEDSGRDLLIAWQDGRCALCGETGALVEDHDHETGMVRGFLCRTCNSMEGHASEGADGRIGCYRERPPTVILGIGFQYIDPWTGRTAEHRTEGFDPWANADPSHCRQCYAFPGEPCECSPIFRLDQRRVVASIVALFLTAQAVNIKDARRAYDSYTGDAKFTPEDFLVRDLLLRPKTADFVERWLGGCAKSMQYSAAAVAKLPVPNDPVMKLLSDSAGLSGKILVPLLVVSQLLAAVSQASLYATKNDYQPISMICAKIINQLSVPLRNAVGDSESAAALPASTVKLAADTLHATAGWLSEGHWRALDGEEELTPAVIRALRADADLAAQLIEHSASRFSV